MKKPTGLIAIIFILPLLLAGTAYADLNEGLVAYYPFDGNANDVSGNINHGIVHGATLTADRFGNLNSAYSFNGGSYIKVSRSSSIEPSNAITVSSWVKPNNVTQWHQVLTKRYSEHDDPWNSYIISTSNEGANNKWLFAISNGASGSRVIVIDTEVIVPNEWVHIVGTYDGSNIKLYVNGILKASKDRKPRLLILTNEDRHCLTTRFATIFLWKN
jgi:hypothetical protein